MSEKIEKFKGTSLRISGSRKALADSLSIDISSKLGVVIRPSYVLNFVLDKYLNPQLAELYVEEYQRKNGIKNKKSGEFNSQE